MIQKHQGNAINHIKPDEKFLLLFHQIPIMRNLSIIFIGLLALSMLTTGCKNSPEQKAIVQGEELWFEEVLHDYGEIQEDGDGSWTFKFKNNGKEAVVINRVRSTCGCTVPAWPREPIEPDGAGEITVKYNTAQAGTFLKSLYVYSSAANSPLKLQIKGKVIPKEE